MHIHREPTLISNRRVKLLSLYFSSQLRVRNLDWLSQRAIKFTSQLGFFTLNSFKGMLETLSKCYRVIKYWFNKSLQPKYAHFSMRIIIFVTSNKNGIFRRSHGQGLIVGKVFGSRRAGMVCILYFCSRNRLLKDYRASKDQSKSQFLK